MNIDSHPLLALPGLGSRSLDLLARAATIPAGSWLMEMRVETAAAYCDESRVDAFLAKVQLGTESRAMSERCRR